MTVTELSRRATARTAAGASRWVPTRAGIINIWRYYDETFEFHHGRLLLRGPNGSGKSKALELLLPFLFDANLRSNRLSTFGTSERTMHWNLMGEGSSGTTRVGYVWLEFGFSGDQDRWFSCGARLQASSHTSTVHPDYFTTSTRIGGPDGVALVNAAGQPLTRSALEEELGDAGVVHGNATEYRATVRSTLFPALNEQRFDALITALLQLRTPKLSQRLDPALLSTLLSRALPPLGQQEISDLAEGFERLDAQRERLKTLEEEVVATRTLASRQQAYAQRVLRARAAALVTATTELDSITRKARQSDEEHRLAHERKESAETLVETLEQQIEETDARITGLTESEGYKQGQELDRLRRQTAAAQTRAGSLRADASAKQADAAGDAGLAREARARQLSQENLTTIRGSEAHQAAVRSGLVSLHNELADNPAGSSSAQKNLLRAAIQSRTGQLEVVGEALTSHEQAIIRREEAEAELEAARAAHSEAKAQLDAVVDQRAMALSELEAQVQAWAAACCELAFDNPEELADHLEPETELMGQVDAVAAVTLQQISRDEAVHEGLLGTLTAELRDLEAKKARLDAHQDIPPAAPATRTTDRTLSVGAPLWRLVDFAESVSDSTRAGVEAALEASGLLDAWLGPRGEIEGHDIFADPEVLVPVSGRSLADVLVPEHDAPVDPDDVRRLLSAVAFDEQLPPGSPAAIGAIGTWRMGALTGSWHKEDAAYIGSAARARARQRELSTLISQLRELESTIAAHEQELATLRTRREVVRAERAARPSHDELSRASHLLTQAESDLKSADRVVRERVRTVAERESAATRALHELMRLASEHAVPTSRSALSELTTAIRAFSSRAELWLDERENLISATELVANLDRQAERSAAIASEREVEAAAEEAEHRRLASMLSAIDSTISADYREVLAEIDTARRELKELDTTRRSKSHEVLELAERLGALQSQRVADAKERDQSTTGRDIAAQQFRHLSTTTFPADSALGELARFTSILTGSDGVRATLDAARLVAAAWPLLPHTPKSLGDALHRLSESVHASRTALSSRADLDLETDEDLQVFTAVVDGVRVGASELLRILREDAERSRHEITDRERELFDQTLTGDTRRHLAARIRQANELVDGMNARLDRVRTASQVAVRLVWQVAPDLPAGTKTARDLLLKDPVQLSESDRQSLHQFFRDRIDQAKADDTATSWEQQLAQVFDYTAWHRFAVKVDRANGAGWQLLTKKLHGALSGGEKAIVLHLPLFAAVAAHYQAEPQAPRVILLDEVFVGVDTTNRGQIFALLSTLDLDLVLTSDHEWCTYAELSGIGIHQLITGNDGDDAVTTARFTWDGSTLLSAED